MSTATTPADASIALSDLRSCFEGAVPAVISTAAVDRTPNVTYLSKTARNLAENPRASVLVIDPQTCDQFRLSLAYERTDRRGQVFERLRDDVEVIAAATGMQGVFKLRAADIYRVVHIEHIHGAAGQSPAPAPGLPEVVDAAAVGELSARLSRCPDLDTLVSAAVGGLAELFGYEHSLLLLLDEGGSRLYTIASHGYDAEGVGSEVGVGDGIVGIAAARCKPVAVGAMRQIMKYSRSVRRSYEDSGAIGPGREIPVPGLAGAESGVAVPAMALGELVGVLMVESSELVAFGAADEAVLTVVASLVANAIEVERARERAADVAASGPPEVAAPPGGSSPPANVRFFPVDGSTFIDGDYLIKGVAGRILWALLGQHDRDGRVDFTNREVRLDPTLEMPEFRDNFESRLILLKRRLDEHGAPIRIEKTGRGRFRLLVDAPVRLTTA